MNIHIYYAVLGDSILFKEYQLLGFHEHLGTGKRRNSNFLNKNTLHGLPWWHSGQESACQCRGHRFNPWSGKIPHATEQLSPCATTTEPVL